jgi:hypothetical protein
MITNLTWLNDIAQKKANYSRSLKDNTSGRRGQGIIEARFERSEAGLFVRRGTAWRAVVAEVASLRAEQRVAAPNSGEFGYDLMNNPGWSRSDG